MCSELNLFSVAVRQIDLGCLIAGKCFHVRPASSWSQHPQSGRTCTLPSRQLDPVSPHQLWNPSDHIVGARRLAGVVGSGSAARAHRSAWRRTAWREPDLQDASPL
ncbi:hypothetical protein BN1012_Phect1655 [Candidatus Phaeomarinobacter ectocarpi]|uniref:Uncharacterized protein n=1 Tax=Candidatus Phaeomarinibacter ectocarpi TaxID=1458461 RepID=X5MFJ2_9HYPH|nr:hypothetical protein BN1012_Phect1655 [Candidatus Phaeomarinobacter ectocarpi]